MTVWAAHDGRALTAPPPFGLSVRSLGNGALWLAAFLSAFVIEEPAPYELYMVALTVIWLACGLKLRREFAPLIVLMMVFTAGGLASVPFAEDFGDALMYAAVSGFLAITAIFYAAILSDKPERSRIIERGYIIGAVIAALFGIAGYFNLFPGAEYFTRFDRARGTFQDPNVFGPFLVLPTLLLIQRFLRGPTLRNLYVLLPLSILLLGIFLSFSRGAWGVLLASLMLLYTIQLVTEQNLARRGRLILIGMAGVFFCALLMTVALSFEAVSDMFSQRARLVQDYDGGRLGRFARYAIGFQLVMEHPLGLGALEFGKTFGEDEHNVYLKAFTTYGWMGGIAYIVMAIWTVCAFLPLIFKSRPWTPFVQAVFAVFVAHLLLSVVIDTDHWRHLFMLYGLAWGLIAADKLERRSWQRSALQTPIPD
ncbi:O-antigen ligase family protein [Roseibium sp.]|uniref:O-antigen ligase family protein n=1 Tax=Roseibium sp. TaxID=1936156 RepID=UPI00391BC096